MKFKALTLLLIAPLLASCHPSGTCFDDYDWQNVVRWEADESFYVKGDFALCAYREGDWTKYKEEHKNATKEDWIAQEVRKGASWSAMSLSKGNLLDSTTKREFMEDTKTSLPAYMADLHWKIADDTKFCLYFNAWRDNSGFADKQKCESYHIKSLSFTYQFSYQKRDTSEDIYVGSPITISLNDKTVSCPGDHNLAIIEDNLANPFNGAESVLYTTTWHERLNYNNVNVILSQKHTDNALDNEENIKKFFVRAEKVSE